MALSRDKPLAVIKVGGDVLLDEAERVGLASNVKDLHDLGWNVIILHGGGPQVNALQHHHGLKPNKIAGRRVTSIEDLQVVKQAIAGEVNVNLVSLLSAVGLPAFGCHGASSMLIEATKRPPIKVTGEGDTLIDFGEVGDVVSINTKLIDGLFNLGLIPVVATLGINNKGRVFNINADTTVSQIASSLKADLLLLITQIGGIYENISDLSSLISSITPVQASRLISEGIIKDGMIPKVEESVRLLEHGVGAIVIAAARREGLFKALANADNSDTELPATRISKAS